MSKQIAVIVGSLRKESFNRKMAKVLIKLAPKSLKLDIVEIGNLSLYNQDFDNAPPAEWVTFRDQVSPCDGVIFVTPEYNRSMPGVLKNAIDIGSRPYGKSVWQGKAGAVISVSPGAIGGFGANQHLRQTFVFLDIPILQQPEAYIGRAGELFNEQGEITNKDTQALVQKFINAYADWVEIISQNYAKYKL